MVLVGGAVVALGIIQLLVVGDPDAFAQKMAVATQQLMEALRDGNFVTLAEMLGNALAVVAIILAGFIVQTTTQFAAYRLGFGHADTTTDALIYGFKAALTSFLFTIVVGMAVGVIIVALTAVLGLGASAAGSGASAVGVVLLFGLGFIFLLLWLFARLCLMSPTMADAGSINPLYGVAQSWRMTAPNQWAILAYIVLLLIVAGTLSGVLGFVLTLFGSTIGSLFSSILVDAPLSILALAVFAGIYRRRSRSG